MKHQNASKKSTERMLKNCVLSKRATFIMVSTPGCLLHLACPDLMSEAQKHAKRIKEATKQFPHIEVNKNDFPQEV
jgi:hypothetical protein